MGAFRRIVSIKLSQDLCTGCSTCARGYRIYDLGTWPEPPIMRRIVTSIAEPQRPESDDKQSEIVEKTLRAARRASGRAYPETLR